MLLLFPSFKILSYSSHTEKLICFSVEFYKFLKTSQSHNHHHSQNIKQFYHPSQNSFVPLCRPYLQLFTIPRFLKYLGCCNKNTIDWLVSNRSLFLIVWRLGASVFGV